MWLEFLWLHSCPSPTSHPMQNWSSLSLSHQLHIIIAYIKWLYEYKQWTSKQISSNISGVRDFIRGHLLDLTAFNHESVTLALRATQSNPRALSISRETKKRLPITTEMVNWYKELAWKYGPVVSRDDIDQRMTFLGVVIGLTFLRRVSEYAYEGRTSHAILADDVHFITLDEFPIAIPSFQVKNHALLINNIDSIRFIFRTSKTDQGGRGTYLFLRRHNMIELELIKCFLHWCMISCIEAGLPFLCRVYNGQRKMLRPRMVNDALKNIADAFGFQHVRDSFTSHSLRIGGATALIASGVSRETIQRIGGWSLSAASSDSIYELNTPRENSNLWSVLNNRLNSNITVQDIHAIIPPSYHRN